MGELCHEESIGATVSTVAEQVLLDRKTAAPAVPADEEPNLVLDELGDRLEAFKRLRKSDEAAADAILDEFGASGKAEEEIVSELSKRKPLALPGRFEEAHQLAMRAFEVLDRNGARSAKLPKMGPLTPLAGFGVQLITRFIVRNFQSGAINSVRNLYIRRETQCAAESHERRMLRRARMDCDRVAPTMKRNPLGVPTFLLGGAVISTIMGSLGQAVNNAKSGRVGLIVATVIVALLVVGLSWVILRGAAVARKRIRLSTDQPLKALWETVGAAGKPPKDSARQFALIAIILTGAGFIVTVLGVIWALLS